MIDPAGFAAPEVKNVCCVFKLSLATLPLTLSTLAPDLPNAEYAASKMNAIIVRIPGITKTTAMLFASGTVTLTGSRSEIAAKTSADKVATAVGRALRTRVSVHSFSVRNIVCSWSVGYRIRLERVAQDCFKNANYEPELFPGLRLKMSIPSAQGDTKLTAQIFSSGKVVFLGAKSIEAVNSAASTLYRDVLPQHMFVVPS